MKFFHRKIHQIHNTPRIRFGFSERPCIHLPLYGIWCWLKDEECFGYASFEVSYTWRAGNIKRKHTQTPHIFQTYSHRGTMEKKGEKKEPGNMCFVLIVRLSVWNLNRGKISAMYTLFRTHQVFINACKTFRIKGTDTHARTHAHI